MKIGNSSSATPLVRSGAVRASGKLAAAGKSGSAKGADQARAAGDVTSIMGIPTAELTPKVRLALTELMTEAQQLRDEIERLKQRAQHLEQLADQDSLAPILNRRAFVRELSRNSAFAERYAAGGSVLYFDINDMKEINDAFGHAAGDIALKHVANVLLQNVRASDVVGRLGGDEFGVILAQSQGQSADEKAKALAEAIATPVLEHNGNRFQVGVAYGVYTLAQGDKVDAALDAADRAMYAQKRAGQGQRPD